MPSIRPVDRCPWQPYCWIDDYGMPHNEMRPSYFEVVMLAYKLIRRVAMRKAR